MRYFTSDWHLGENRIGINGKPNLFYRPFTSIEEQNRTIIDNFLTSGFKDGDELWHLGDVVYEWSEEVEDYLSLVRDEFPNSKFNLVIGNYDEDKMDNLVNYFDESYHDAAILIEVEESAHSVYLNHYPKICVKEMQYNIYDFYITGHIHGLWKFQKKMVNVGVDAWHFKPVSEEEVEFCMIACEKYYDNNVFPY